MPSKTVEQRERAEAKFERLQKVAEEGRVAMAEYRAASDAMKRKTERLRALRLALEAGVDAPTPPLNGAKKAAKTTPRSTKKSRKTH